MDDEKKSWISNGSATSPTDNDSSHILGLNISAPKFEHNLANCILVDGADITFSCRVTGTPVPNVSALRILFGIYLACVRYCALYNTKGMHRGSSMFRVFIMIVHNESLEWNFLCVIEFIVTKSVAL